MGIELGNGDCKLWGWDPPPPFRYRRLARNLLLFFGLDGIPRAKFVHPLGLSLKSSF